MSGCNYAAGRLRAHLDGELSGSERQRVAAHLGICAGCRQRLASMAATAELVRRVPLEDTPPHFSANLQVRLASLRAAGPSRPAGGRRHWLRGLTDRLRPVARRPAMALGGAVVLAGIVAAMLIAPPRASVADIARWAGRSWENTQNYSCEMIASGVYQGKERTFRQSTWFAKPGLYRLQTEQDYPLVSVFDPVAIRHFIPGGDWQGRGPLNLVRPRVGGPETLPFPFGITWPSGPNATIGSLIHELRATRNAVLLGTERVLGRDCYQVRFRALPPGGRREETCTLSLAQDYLLPVRVERYRDPENRITTTAVNLLVNLPPNQLPSNLFSPEYSQTVGPDSLFTRLGPATGPVVAFEIHGDVDPHVFALKPPRTPEFDRDPLAATRREVAIRASGVPFPALAPESLPREFHLVRVRHARGRWLDIHWIDDRQSPARVIRLTEQDAAGPEPLETADGRTMALSLPSGPVTARIREGREPYPFCFVSWRQEGTLLTLATAELPLEETLRMARSTRLVPPLTARPVQFVGPPAPPLDRAPTAPAAPTEESASLPALSMEITPAPSVEPPMLPDTAELDDARLEPAGH